MNIDADSRLSFTPSSFLSKRVAVLGTTGSGKSNTVAVLLEELLPHLPFMIIDPHGEYYTLREKFDVLIVGQSDNADLQITIEQASEIALWSYRERKSVILDLYKVVEEEERLDYVFAFLNPIWEHSRSIRLGNHQPYGIVLEEAHNFIPESLAKKPTLQKLKTFANEGRKFGFSMIASTQRASKMSKDFLAACEIRFFHRVSDYPDVQAYAERLTYKPPETKRIVMNMATGQAIVRTPSDQQVVQIRQRSTTHVQANVTLDDASRPALRPINDELLDELRNALTPPVVDVSNQTDEALRAQAVEDAEEIQRLRQTITSLEAEVARWRDQVVERDAALVIAKHDLRQAAAKLKKRTLAPSNQMALMAAAEQQRVVEETTTTTTTRRVEFQSSRSLKIAVNRQTAAFGRLLGELEALTPMERNILVLLAEDATQSFTVAQVIRVLDYSFDSGRKAAAKLHKMGLLARIDTYVYQSIVERFFSDQFPNLELDDLLRQFFAALTI